MDQHRPPSKLFVFLLIVPSLLVLPFVGCRRRDRDAEARRRRFVHAVAVAFDLDDGSAAPPPAPTPDPEPALTKPAPLAPIVITATAPRPASTVWAPMNEARACLRDNPTNMAAGNECVVLALRDRAATEAELGLLAVTYRTMGRTRDATRAMSAYRDRFPDGPRASAFSAYIAEHPVDERRADHHPSARHR